MRNGLQDSERALKWPLGSVVRRWNERLDGVGEENDSDVEHSERPLLATPRFLK